MDAVNTAAGAFRLVAAALRLASALVAGGMNTRAWHVAVSARGLRSLVCGRMQESVDGFVLGILVPIVLATAMAMRFRRGLARAGVHSVRGPLCFFAAAVPLQIMAVHVAALDVVAGPGWARARAVAG